MVSDAKWQDRARALLKVELARENVGYKELAEKLGEIGVKETRAEHREQDEPGRLQCRLAAPMPSRLGMRGRLASNGPISDTLVSETGTNVPDLSILLAISDMIG